MSVRFCVSKCALRLGQDFVLSPDKVLRCIFYYYYYYVLGVMNKTLSEVYCIWSTYYVIY